MPATPLHICLSTVLGSFWRRQLEGSGTIVDGLRGPQQLTCRQPNEAAGGVPREEERRAVLRTKKKRFSITTGSVVLPWSRV